jgi:hypothetical protein
LFSQAIQPLRFRRFRTVLAGEGLSMLGDRAFEVALAWLVLRETGSVAALASVLLAQAIPRALLMLSAERSRTGFHRQPSCSALIWCAGRRSAPSGFSP